MSLKQTIALLLFLFLSEKAISQRNVILIIADDLGTDYCGFYEDHSDTAPLPNLRRLLPKAVRFTNAMSHPVCSPTRAGILTGRYSFRTGVGDAVGGVGSATLDTSETTIPRILKQNISNIATANIGKWHLHNQSPATNLQIPNRMGYDFYAGNFLGALSSYTNWTKITNGVSSTSTNYATTETTDDAISWIKTTTNKPFFLWLAYNAPHTPLHLPPAGLHTYTGLTGTVADINANPKKYFKAMLQSLDHEMGRLLDTLSLYNKLDSTDIIFIGDNGNGIRSAQIANTDRAKGTIYQYGVHIPFIISGPSVINPYRISTQLVNTHDLFATIIELFGVNNWKQQIPTTTTIDSKSILPILKNIDTAIRPWAFTEIFKVTTDSADGKAMRNKEYKLLKFDYGAEEFYHLTSDSLELTNLLNDSLNTVEYQNYSYLCSQMAALTGNNTFCKPVLVPLTITNYQLLLLEKSVKNIWTVANEFDVKNYVVQRSNDGIHFANIGSIASNKQNEGKYFFADNLQNLLPHSTSIWYRILVVKKDGSAVNTVAKKINLPKTSSVIRIFPNPSESIINIDCADAKEIIITNSIGKEVYRSGTTTPINAHQFAKGIYSIKIITATGGIKTEKLLIQ